MTDQSDTGVTAPRCDGGCDCCCCCHSRPYYATTDLVPPDGRARVLGGELALLSGEFALLGGEFALLGGEFALLSGEFALLSGEFALLSGEFAFLAGEFALHSGEFAVLSGVFGILFADVAGAFQTAFQAAPLDYGTVEFYTPRYQKIQENIPALPPSDWSAVRIYLRFLRPIGPRKHRERKRFLLITMSSDAARFLGPPT
eukprot:1190873-Prorocentrum_minimum.AAC.2